MISVIVPIYKVEDYLAKCIESIQKQSFKDLEIILVDDGSPDRCGEICDRYKQQDGRIKVIHKQNGGLSDARNAGIDVAEGEYISFIDSDDYIHPQMMEILYNILQEAEADISVCEFKQVSEQEDIDFAYILKPVKTEKAEGQQVMNQLQHKNLITVVAWNKLYRAKLFENNRYKKGMIHEDEFMIHHLLHECNCIVYTKEPLYFYIQRKNSITGTVKWNQVKDGWSAYIDRLAFLEKHNYEQMQVWTRLHMLHYIVVYYDKLMNIDQANRLLADWREAFKGIYRDKVVKSTLQKQLLHEYKYFVINPRIYYNMKEKSIKCDDWLSKFKKQAKKLVKK